MNSGGEIHHLNSKNNRKNNKKYKKTTWQTEKYMILYNHKEGHKQNK